MNNNLSWVKEKKANSNHIKICKTDFFWGGYIYRYNPRRYAPGVP